MNKMLKYGIALAVVAIFFLILTAAISYFKLPVPYPLFAMLFYGGIVLAVLAVGVLILFILKRIRLEGRKVLGA